MTFRNRRRRQSGFTYLALLFFVAVSGASLAVTGILWSTEQQRQKEKELRAIGADFQRAIESYYQRTPGAIKRYPNELEDLLLDRRQAGLVRHVRRIHRDPFTLEAKWGVVRAQDGGIQGVHSLSEAKPVGGPPGAKYRSWTFSYFPQ